MVLEVNLPAEFINFLSTTADLTENHKNVSKVTEIWLSD